MKEFNTTGLCIPKKHYMVDITGKLDQIMSLVENGRYFTINRGRQYGKTTTFSRLDAALRDHYLVLRMSFEGVDEDNFDSNEDFVRMFVRLAAGEMERRETDEKIIAEWNLINGVDALGKGITSLCRASEKPVILMIDEVDKSSNSQPFLNFLGMLRNKYLDAQEERDVTFWSVILAGVYDIKNLKLKIRPDAEKMYNSPWNIAADFNVDMSFSAKEIATMLESYEADAHTGMDIRKISETLRFYTGGYPFLVSWLCKWMDERGGRVFTEENVTAAVREFSHTKNTLIDDMFKKVYDNPDFADMLRSMLLQGVEYSFVMTVPAIELGVIFGILVERDQKAVISNIMFETCLYDNFLTEQTLKKNDFRCEKSQFYTKDGHLDMPQVLRKFQELMNAEYRKEDGAFYERQGGLLFLCFLKPIINGTGSYFVEPQTRNHGQMDIVVFYERVEYIIELKIWHGEQYRNKGLEQLAGYMESRNVSNGYLVSFNFNKNKEPCSRKIEVNAANSGRTCEIFEVMI